VIANYNNIFYIEQVITGNMM